MPNPFAESPWPYLPGNFFRIELLEESEANDAAYIRKALDKSFEKGKD